MPGGISQLVSYGAQDVYLTGNPQITFFKAIYRRYTNFAVESIQQALDGTTDFGKFPTCTISRNGDLAGPIWIEVTLPSLLGYNITPTPPISSGSTTLANASNVLTLSNVFADSKGNYWQNNNYGTTGYANLIAAYSNVTGNYYANATLNGSGNVVTSVDLTSNVYTWPYMTAITNPSNASLRVYSVPTSNLRYVNGIGLALFNSVELQLGGQRIDKHYSEWWDIWSELTETSEHLQGYNQMVGRYDTDYYNSNYDITQAQGGTYYVPLKFCYNNNPGQYLPLVALSYHDVKLNFDINSYLNCIRCNYPVTSLTSMVGSNPLSISNFKLYCDYVFLDAPERIRMSEIQHEYLVTQLQWQGSEPVTAPSAPNGTTNRKFTINFNHPVKCIVIAYQAASSYEQGDAVNGNDIFNYQIPGDSSAEIIESMTLLINGSERFSARPGKYFRLVQPYQHSVRVPSKSIYLYSFALEDIDSKQPCGSANFTRYDSAQLQMVLNQNLPSGRFLIYAPNYNILRVASGMGGLAFSS